VLITFSNAGRLLANYFTPRTQGPWI